MNLTGPIKRETLIHILWATLTAIVAFTGIVLGDRLRLERYETQVDINTETIKHLPDVYVTRSEWSETETAMQQQVLQQHTDIFNELHDIRGAILELNRSMIRRGATLDMLKIPSRAGVIDGRTLAAKGQSK